MAAFASVEWNAVTTVVVSVMVTAVQTALPNVPRNATVGSGLGATSELDSESNDNPNE